MKNRLKYNDINKSNYIKNVLTFVLVIAFLFVSGRYLFQQAKQGINDIKINNNSVQQEKTVEKTENTKEVEKILPIPEQIEEREKIYAKAEKQANIKTEKEKNLSVKLVVNDDTLRTQLKEHVTQNKTPVKNNKYTIYIGSYSSRFEAERAKEVMVDSHTDLSPTIKQLGSKYVLLIGTYSSKSSADNMYNKLTNEYYYPAQIIEENN